MHFEYFSPLTVDFAQHDNKREIEKYAYLYIAFYW